MVAYQNLRLFIGHGPNFANSVSLEPVSRSLRRLEEGWLVEGLLGIEDGGHEPGRWWASSHAELELARDCNCLTYRRLSLKMWQLAESLGRLSPKPTWSTDHPIQQGLLQGHPEWAGRRSSRFLLQVLLDSLHCI